MIARGLLSLILMDLDAERSTIVNLTQTDKKGKAHKGELMDSVSAVLPLSQRLCS